MKNKFSVYPFFAIAIVSMLTIACGGGPALDKAAQLQQLKDQKAELDAKIIALEKEIGATAGAAKKVKTVGLSEAKSDVFRHYIDLQGKVEAENSVQATSKMPGTLRRVLVSNGSQVSKGQLIAEIEDDVMLKNLEPLETQLKTAKDIYERQKSLWDQKIGTEIAFIQAKTQVEILEKNIAAVKEQWAQTKIYAPIGGTVDMVVLKPGQAIAPGMPLCFITNLGDLKVKGDVTEAYVAKVRQGDAVQLDFPDLSRSVASRVKYVSKTINPTNRTFAVECALPGTGYSANMVAVMKIIDYQNANAITVPINVIQTGEGGDFVYIVEKSGERQGTVRKALVKQGQNYNGQVEILSGLNKGDQIITTGFQDVNPGETVAF